MQGEAEARLMGLKKGIGQKGLIVLAKEDPKIVGLLREALSRETDPVVRARIQEIVDAVDNKKGGIDASTSLSINSQEGKPGGIDFRALPMNTQPLGTELPRLRGVPHLVGVTDSKLDNLDLDVEPQVKALTETAPIKLGKIFLAILV